MSLFGLLEWELSRPGAVPCLSLSSMPGTQSALSRGSWVEGVETDARVDGWTEE